MQQQDTPPPPPALFERLRALFTQDPLMYVRLDMHALVRLLHTSIYTVFADTRSLCVC